MSEENPAENNEDLGELLKVRREKLDSLREMGVDPFGKKFEITDSPAALRENFEEEKQVRIAGRITALRDMGKSNFLDISDIHGRIQIFVNQKQIGEEQWAAYKQLCVRMPPPMEPVAEAAP